MKIALAQLNLRVGDISGNVAKIKAFYLANTDADIVAFPELAITGYSPEDLVLKKDFQASAMKAVDELAAITGEAAMLVGGLWCEGHHLHNAAFLLQHGKLIYTQYKHLLPNYRIFDEKRTFIPGPLPSPIDFKGKKLGIFICEDLWWSEVPEALKDSDVCISINASPYEPNKPERRLEKARRMGKPLSYVNLIGGQDDVVFDGGSFEIDAAGEIVTQLEHTDLYGSLVMALKDYAEFNGFKTALLGFSGGIDSGLVAAIAVDALGKENVTGVMLPSPYTSEESRKDAEDCAKYLGIRLEELPITPLMASVETALQPFFKDTQNDITEENLQSRIRGLLLMALSNKFGSLLLATGNKSEMATGYATLYGDMCGGFAPIKDVYKTQVFELARARGLPQNMIEKAPTAELKANQKDQDTLPPYALLDKILHALIEEDLPVSDIRFADSATVKKVARMLYLSEYKRRQSPPGPKVSDRAFTRERRYPITSGYKG